MIQHLQGREKALESFGWKGREGEWVALVCLHSGVFTRAQFRHFFDSGDNRQRAARFVRDLVGRELGVVDERAIFPGGAKAVRISNKEIYRKLGIENIRHRREADDANMLRRLLSLDYVLEHPELPWLPTETEKVAFFDSLGIDRRRLPKRLYHGANGNQARYFALKLPIACEAKTATFVYVDPGKDTDTELRSWGDSHEWLWRALRSKGMVGPRHRSRSGLQSHNPGRGAAKDLEQPGGRAEQSTGRWTEPERPWREGGNQGHRGSGFVLGYGRHSEARRVAGNRRAEELFEEPSQV